MYDFKFESEIAPGVSKDVIDIAYDDSEKQLIILNENLTIKVCDLNGEIRYLIKDISELFIFERNEDDMLSTSFDVFSRIAISGDVILILEPLSNTLVTFSISKMSILNVVHLKFSCSSIAASSDCSQVLLGGTNTGTIYEGCLELLEFNEALQLSRNARPVLTASGGQVCAIDDHSGDVCIYDFELDEKRGWVNLCPDNLRQQSEGNESFSYIFGIDAAMYDDTVTILHGRGGFVFPSLWRLNIASMKVSSYRWTLEGEPVRIVANGANACVLLCKCGYQTKLVRILF